MLASSSSRLIDDFDENSDEKHFYSSSLTAETHNYHSTFLDDFCEQTIKDEEFNGEEQIEATSTSHCRTTTVEFDPHLAIIIENELGLNDPQTSRKNAWGNLSYAELIAKAIEHSQDKRLTLSQIYSWMIQYVPYFRDKGDRKSSTGWKVSQIDRQQKRDTSVSSSLAELDSPQFIVAQSVRSNSERDSRQVELVDDRPAS